MFADLGGLVVLACLGAVVVVVAGGRRVSARPPRDATYIGQKKCRICHFKEYRSWKKTKHAKAWSTLPEEDRGRPGCYRRHVTGYGEAGGYVNESETPRLSGVQCESCHGPGSAHAEAAKVEEDEEKIDALIDKVPRNTCIEYHNAHKTREDFEKESRKGEAEGDTPRQ